MKASCRDIDHNESDSSYATLRPSIPWCINTSIQSPRHCRNFYQACASRVYDTPRVALSQSKIGFLGAEKVYLDSHRR